MIRSFNFFGLSVTRNVSATSRSIIDTLRTLFIWLISLGLGWEKFNWLQVLGMAQVRIMGCSFFRFRDFGVGNVYELALRLNCLSHFRLPKIIICWWEKRAPFSIV